MNSLLFIKAAKVSKVSFSLSFDGFIKNKRSKYKSKDGCLCCISLCKVSVGSSLPRKMAPSIKVQNMASDGDVLTALPINHPMYSKIERTLRLDSAFYPIILSNLLML